MRYAILLPICIAIGSCGNVSLAVTGEQASSLPNGTSVALANAFARLIETAIPREYDKRKNWGHTKNITVGLRNEGFKIHRRKKPVKHGVWKHYKLKLVEPEDNLKVRIENLRTLDKGRIGFTLTLQAKFDLWARVKVYQYGIHIIALETLGDVAIDLALDCEVGLSLQTQSGDVGVSLDPRVTHAQLDITDFHLHRVSNAKGPLVRELGEELPQIIERELQGPKLVAKLNRAINKKRDRVELSFSEWVGMSTKK